MKMKRRRVMFWVFDKYRIRDILGERKSEERPFGLEKQTERQNRKNEKDV
jgi:hypothetical protein